MAEAVGGREALELLEREAFDLVISDVQLPELDGRELLRRIRGRAELADMRVLLIGGGQTEDDARRLLQAGADGVLHKPFGLRELRAAIERTRAS